MPASPSPGPRLRARFRFDPHLNLFLAPAHRDQEIECDCPPEANLKHMVEALGVPHTEVGAVLVDGRLAELQQRLEEDDRVHVLAVDPAERLAPQERPRFIADAHLGALARLLRMAGFDTLYDNNFDDRVIVQTSVQESRIVLSRDRDLLKHRDVQAGCYVRSLAPPDQFHEILHRFRLPAMARPFALCLACNVELDDISLDEAAKRVPDGVRARQRRFKTCPACRRIYWEGTHWTRMRALLDELMPPRPG